MVHGWNFKLIFLFIPYFVISQNNINNKLKKKGLRFKTQTLMLFYYNKENNVTNQYQKEFALEDNTKIYGVNTEVNYFFNTNFAIGLGLGYEKLTQPKIIYNPLYINFLGVFYEDNNSMYTKFNFGGHIGKVDKQGFLFRWGLGYRVHIYKNLSSNFEMTYSYQNLYKTFEKSEREFNIYNVRSVGLSIGLTIN